MIPALAAAAVLAASPLTGAAAAEQAPECVAIVVPSHQADGTVVRLHLEFCGNGPGADSPLHDSAARWRYDLDGGGLPGPDCGTRREPCVIIGGP